MRTFSVLLSAVAALAFCISAYGDEDSHGEAQGEAIGSTCPSPSPPTYDSFGCSFMESYCTRCRGTALAGGERNGAPEDHDFETLGGVLAVAKHIDEYAASGPAATNTTMPSSGPTPSDAERNQLDEWLACEMAK